VIALLPGRASPAGTSERNGTLAASLIILVATALGYAAAAWTDGSRKLHEEQAERASHYVAPPDPLADSNVGAPQGAPAR
jgi:hypothetical protein